VTDRVRLGAALTSANVAAFLRVLREGESSQQPIAYGMRWGGLGKPVAYFRDFTRHPRVFEPTTGGRVSSAAGAYQITATTYDDIAPWVGVTDFSPESQDLLAVALIARRGALDDVIAGRLESAIAKLGATWTSLPGGAENRRMTLDSCRAVYQRWGGKLADPATQEPAPIEDRSVPWAPPEDSGRIFNPDQEAPMPAPLLALAPLVVPLVQSMIEAFTPLAKQKIASEINRHTDNPEIGNQIAGSILATAQALTRQADPVAAVAAVKADPVLAQQAETSALEALDRLAPLLDKIAMHDKAVWAEEDAGRDAAGVRGRADGENDVGPLVVKAIIGLVVGTLAGCFAIMGIQTAFSPSHEPSTSMLTLVGPLIGAVFGSLGTIVAYRFGTTRNNSLKDITMEQLSRRPAPSFAAPR